MKIQTTEIVVNSTSGVVRTENLDGREYTVAPFTLMTEDVHAGSDGPLYYNGEQLKAATPAWEKKPLTLNHPKDKGDYISAETPGVLDKLGLGFTRSMVWNGKSQSGEVWIDNVKAKEIAPRLILSLNAGIPVAVSSGLVLKTDDKPGVFNGKSYIGSTFDHKPDHVAILLDSSGACTVDAGCGVLVGNAAMGGKTPQTSDVLNQSHNSRRLAVMSAMDGDGHDKYSLRDVYNDFFIHQHTNGDMYKRMYNTNSDGSVVISKNAPEKVKRITEYRTEDNKFVGNCAGDAKCNACKTLEASTVSKKKEYADKLIGNGQGAWKETDRPTLENLSEDILAKMTNPITVNTATAVLAPVLPVPAGPRQMTVNEFLASAPPELRSPLQDLLSAGQAERQRLVANIAASPLNRFSQEWLNTQSVEVLRGLDSLVSGGTPAPIYTGMAGNVSPLVANAAVPVKGLEDTNMDFTKK